MEILVLYKDFSYALVKDYSLDKLIKEEKILGFQRSNGWVSIGHDPVRGGRRGYSGPERRRNAQTLGPDGLFNFVRETVHFKEKTRRAKR